MSQRRPPRHERRRGAARRNAWRARLPIVGTVVVVAAIVVVFVFAARAREAPPPASGELADVVAKTTSVPASVFDKVAAGGVVPLKPTGGTALQSAQGKPIVVYVGAEYCPYCAAQRWSIVVALSRFGSWSGLELSRSSSTDVFKDTPTFTFRNARYASDLIELSSVETGDRQGNRIASMDAVQQASSSRYDKEGSVPYLSVADRYVVVGSGFTPDVLTGKTWEEIASALSDPASPIAQKVIGNADQISAAICAVTQQRPAPVCSSASVRGLLSAQ